MLKFIEKIIEPIQIKYWTWQANKEYQDIEDTWDFVWGLKSYDDLSSADCNLHTMNDIDITYNKKTKIYSLEIETAYMFDNKKQGECTYLKGLLNAFTRFMNDHNYSTNYKYCFFMSNPQTSMKAETIEELYINFKIFVEGYCKIYEEENIELKKENKQLKQTIKELEEKLMFEKLMDDDLK